MNRSESLRQVVERLWAANESVVRERLRLVEAALCGAEGSDAAAAAAHAHALAGTLGTYGRPGSDLLKESERALRSRGRDMQLAAQVRRLLEQLED